MTATTIDPRAVLLRAADLIDEHGWTQGMFRTSAGCYCADGAILAAAGVDVPLDAEYFTDMTGVTAEIRHIRDEAHRLVLDHLQVGRNWGVHFWNDQGTKSATEVTAALRAAAGVGDRG